MKVWQALSKYIYLSPLLIFSTTSTELGQKTAQCESLRAVLHYVEWDRIVTIAIHGRLISIWKFEGMRSSFCLTFCLQVTISCALASFWRYPYLDRPVWITPGGAPLRWMGPNRNHCWEQKRTEGYVIISITLHEHVYKKNVGYLGSVTI
jgi:hypothetical protein